MMERIEPEIKSSDAVPTPTYAIATSTAVTVADAVADADTHTCADTHTSPSSKDMSIEEIIKEIRRELEGIRQIVSELER